MESCIRVLEDANDRCLAQIIAHNSDHFVVSWVFGHEEDRVILRFKRQY